MEANKKEKRYVLSFTLGQAILFFIGIFLFSLLAFGGGAFFTEKIEAFIPQNLEGWLKKTGLFQATPQELHNLLKKEEMELLQKNNKTEEEVSAGLMFYRTLEDKNESMVEDKEGEGLQRGKKEEKEGKKEEKIGLVGNVYTVQVSAFRNKQQGEKLLEDLRKKEYDAYFTEKIFSNGDTWYRIRVGRFSSIEEAKELTKKLKEEQKLFSYVTLEDK